MTSPLSRQTSSNTKVAIICAAVAVGMIGLAYASVPLYSLFCRVTGYAGTTQRATAPSHEVLDRKMTIRFDANVAPGLDWEFVPEITSTEVRIGENTLAFFRATNRSGVAQTGTATFNVTPEQSGSFFNKVQCFCFTEQRLEPGETVEMPVSFFVDPAIVKDTDGAFVRSITLSYTFHPVSKPKASAAVRPTGPATQLPATKPAPHG
ncbi:MAG: cytochrome c oxidase assembly protein [Hyphomicrobiaceae bacterium]